MLYNIGILNMSRRQVLCRNDNHISVGDKCFARVKNYTSVVHKR